ncbi:epsin-3 [Myxozyma melibiosi]|uniref:Epsin-3 n=1 Tax=Myxozyma melibiosi TaxID=54550 RepID=A0ABR1EZS4_9ASCO
MNAQRVLNNPNIKGLKDAVQNISLYDVKAYVRKAQNVMMNFSPMEAKVREATNNEPWGASGSLMQEIADGTFNYASFNEIMPMIYKRFTEKTASEWRQIYKALQLLEFLVKHGSERVIDDARAHLATISMLRSFHYTDSNGKDQGINVRNRSKELVALLGDDERIRTERKKSRAAKDKYVGVSSFESGLGGGSSSSNSGGFGGTGKKYGGFGSESAEYGGYSGGVYGDGGGFGGESSSRAYAAPSRKSGQFEEYDAGGEDDATTTAYAAISPPTGQQPAKAKAPAVDLFSFDDDDNGNSVLAATPPASPAPAAAAFAAPAAAAASSSAFDEDFDDFQSATPTPTSPKPQASAAASITGLYNQPMQQPTMTMPSYAQPSYVQQPQQYSQFGQFAAATAAAPTTPTLATTTNISATYQTATGPNYNISGFSSGTSSFTPASSAGNGAAAAAKKKDDVFGSLWSTAASGVTKKSGANSSASSNVSMAKLAQQTATAGIWDQARSNSSTSTVPTLASNVNNNNNNSASGSGSGSGSAADDLLLL